MFQKLNAVARPAVLLPAIVLLGACGEESTQPDTSFEEAQPAPVDLTNPDDAPVPDNEVGSGDVEANGSSDADGTMAPAEEAN